MKNKLKKSCRHTWDVLTIIWTKGGQRAYPCKHCAELLVFGNVCLTKA